MRESDFSNYQLFGGIFYFCACNSKTFPFKTKAHFLMKKTISTLRYLAFTGVTALLLSGCVSMSSMQTGRSVGQGNTEINVGGSGVKYGFIVGSEATDTASVSAPMLEADFRYGVTEKLDIGGKVSLLGTSGLYGKYQFLGDRESVLAGSVGAGFGYLQLGADSGVDETSFSIFDLTVPVYFSVHPAKWIGIYATPRYTLRLAGGASHWFGGTGGIRLGNRFGGFAEYSLFTSSNATTNLSQVAFGLSFGIGGK
jgi:hypothetical protein